MFEYFFYFFHSPKQQAQQANQNQQTHQKPRQYSRATEIVLTPPQPSNPTGKKSLRDILLNQTTAYLKENSSYFLRVTKNMGDEGEDRAIQFRNDIIANSQDDENLADITWNHIKNGLGTSNNYRLALLKGLCEYYGHPPADLAQRVNQCVRASSTPYFVSIPRAPIEMAIAKNLVITARRELANKNLQNSLVV
jgi:hypothetical protein